MFVPFHCIEKRVSTIPAWPSGGRRLGGPAWVSELNRKRVPGTGIHVSIVVSEAVDADLRRHDELWMPGRGSA
jgi:hypothetical protein